MPIPLEELLSSGGGAAVFGPPTSSEQDPGQDGDRDERGRVGNNVFVNDPCMDPSPDAAVPGNRRRTVQSETEIAVLNTDDSQGKKMVVGYNDSWGFYDNRQGLSGYAYSTNGGKSWIDGGGLPPRVPSGVSPFTPGVDGYFGDPVVVVHNRTETFYYASIYKSVAGYFTLSVNRGTFRKAPPQGIESRSNTRCFGNLAAHGVPDVPADEQERIIWEPPVEAVALPFLAGGADFLDKEWLYVDQRTGVLYMTYTRFTEAGETPIELVRSFNGGRTWTPPSVIVPNEDFDFNQATQPFTTKSGRVIVTWFARSFASVVPFQEIEQRIEVAYSDDGGNTFNAPVTVARVNPQGEPLGYNRGRATILNAPYIFVDRGRGGDDDNASGFVYVTYFSGKTPFPRPATGFLKAADIFLSRSRDGGRTWDVPVKVNDDNTNTTHVFPSVQVNKEGQVFVAWIDRRIDPVNNRLNETWADVSNDRGRRFGGDVLVSDVATSWSVRADARPNFGDYNSSELKGEQTFVTVWADGRFYPPGGSRATPDTIFADVRFQD